MSSDPIVKGAGWIVVAYWDDNDTSGSLDGDETLVFEQCPFEDIKTQLEAIATRRGGFWRIKSVTSTDYQMVVRT